MEQRDIIVVARGGREGFQDSVIYRLENQLGHNVTVTTNYPDTLDCLQETPADFVIAEELVDRKGIPREHLDHCRTRDGMVYSDIALCHALESQGYSPPFFLLVSNRHMVNNPRGLPDDYRIMQEFLQGGTRGYFEMPITPTELVTGLEKSLGYELYDRRSK